jgi:hypothetical protein
MPCHPDVKEVIPEPLHPPIIDEVEHPKEGYLHISNKAYFTTGLTIMLAFPWQNPLKFSIRINSIYPIDEVLAYYDFNPAYPWTNNIDLRNVIGTNQYENNFNKWLTGKHTLTFIAYDMYGYSSEPKEIEVSCIYLPRHTII